MRLHACVTCHRPELRPVIHLPAGNHGPVTAKAKLTRKWEQTGLWYQRACVSVVRALVLREACVREVQGAINMCHMATAIVWFRSLIKEEELSKGFSSHVITQGTTWFLLSGQWWVQLCHYGLHVCASVCECVQGVSWEATTRAKIWLVFQTAGFGVAESPKTHLPLTSSLCPTTETETQF